MIPALKPYNETLRLEALRAYEILDTPPEQAFDDLTRLASTICDAPIALVSLVDAERQWFKSRVGLEPPETPRDFAFCAHAILQPGLLEIPDATADARFADNPLVVYDPSIRFYAGEPLVTPDGFSLGTLCVIDREPRTLTEAQREALRVLGRQVVSQLELARSCRKLAESLEVEASINARIRESERRYAALAHEVPAGIFETDLRGHCTYANARWCHIAGIPASDALGLGWMQSLHPDDRDAVVREWEAAVRDHRDFQLEYRFLTPDKVETWVEGRATARHDERRTVTGYLGTVLDITWQRRANLAAEEAARTKSEFASTVAHELRTPLTAICEGVDIVLDGVAGEVNEEQREFLGTSKRNIDRLRRLINSVLDYQKLDAGFMEFRLEPERLSDIVRSAVATFSPLACKKGVALVTQLDESVDSVHCDRDKIEQVLANMLSNAIHYTPKGAITVQLCRGHAGAEIRVSDQGPGILPEDQERLFHSFVQLARSGPKRPGGTGLGLAISRKIVEGHGGCIGVESTPGHGATFYFVLPRAVGRAA